MTRLNEQEKQALRDAGLNRDEPASDGSPSWMVEPTPANVERYLRALSQFPTIGQVEKPASFAGTHWKL
jgi:hypothetical protein